MPNNRQFEDFGNHIGGARKELYATGITLDDIYGMSDTERNINLTKNKVWGKVDYQELVNDGRDHLAVYYIKLIKDSLPVKPTGTTLEDGEKYVEFITAIKAAVMGCQREEDIQSFFDNVMPEFVEKEGRRIYVRPEYRGLVTNKFFRAAQVPSLQRLYKEMNDKQFLFDETQKRADEIAKIFTIYKYKDNTEWDKGSSNCFYQVEGSTTRFIYPPKDMQSPSAWNPDTYYVMRNRDVIANNIESRDEAIEFVQDAYEKEQQREKKSKVKVKEIVPYLDNLERTGPDNIKSRNVSPEDIQATFAFYGGEFGNYEGPKDREKNIRLSYDAFCDLGRALNISVKDISLESTLSIAYGARGTGGKMAALAHYEPTYQVINLTKLKGAGSLAHEWGHGLDHFLFNKEFPGSEGRLTLDQLKSRENFASNRQDSVMGDVVKAIFWKEGSPNGRTKFYNDALKLDKVFHSSSIYYCKTEELVARAFACFVYDKLKAIGIKDDYLCGHANIGVYSTQEIGLKGDLEEFLYISPQGEEREAINHTFDKLIENLKERNIFRDFDEKEISLLKQKELQVDPNKGLESYEIEAYQKGKQMSIFDLLNQDTSQKEWKPRLDHKDTDQDISR